MGHFGYQIIKLSEYAISEIYNLLTSQTLIKEASYHKQGAQTELYWRNVEGRSVCVSEEKNTSIIVMGMLGVTIVLLGIEAEGEEFIEWRPEGPLKFIKFRVLKEP